ncbi:MAG TPA: hypothetical protein V6D28_16580 [Leptolyngbyaceae cyanobacterium]
MPLLVEMGFSSVPATNSFTIYSIVGAASFNRKSHQEEQVRTAFGGW